MDTIEYYQLVEFEGEGKAFENYLEGYFKARNIDFDTNVFFDRDYGLEHESFLEKLSEWLHIAEEKNTAIVSENIISHFDAAVHKAPADLKVTLGKRKRIKNLTFPFAFKMFSEEQGHKAKTLLSKPPKGVVIKDLEIDEKTYDDKRDASRGVYTAEHRYVLEGKGSLTGVLEYVMAYYKRLNAFEQLTFSVPHIELGNRGRGKESGYTV